MDTVALGLLVSAIVCASLLLLFRFEKKRGVRFFDHTRTRLDFVVLDILHKVHTGVQVYLKRFLKQFAHFLVHSVLAGMLRILRSFEKNIAHVMRINKTRAKRAERRSEERNKLEEIALHKLEVALSEEEKQERREAELRGE